jgi:hypothetical protein
MYQFGHAKSHFGNVQVLFVDLYGSDSPGSEIPWINPEKANLVVFRGYLNKKTSCTDFSRFIWPGSSNPNLEGVGKSSSLVKCICGFF